MYFAVEAGIKLRMSVKMEWKLEMPRIDGRKKIAKRSIAASLATAALMLGAYTSTSEAKGPEHSPSPPGVGAINGNIEHFGADDTIQTISILTGDIGFFAIVSNTGEEPIYLFDVFAGSTVAARLTFITSAFTGVLSDEECGPAANENPAGSAFSLPLYPPGEESGNPNTPFGPQAEVHLSAPVIVPAGSTLCAIIAPAIGAIEVEDEFYFAVNGFRLME